MTLKFRVAALMLLMISFILAAFAGCRKSHHDAPAGNDNTPRTNPMPAELSYDWQMTTTGGGYVYDGVHYGSSGEGAEVKMQSNGVGWWNTIYQVAAPGCVQVQNLSADCTFEVHHENGRNQVYVYITGGTFHEEFCTAPDKNQDLKDAGMTYPQLAPLVYDYKIGAEDNDPSLPLLLLSQENDETIRFDPHTDLKMLVLKKLN